METLQHPSVPACARPSGAEPRRNIKPRKPIPSTFDDRLQDPRGTEPLDILSSTARINNATHDRVAGEARGTTRVTSSEPAPAWELYESHADARLFPPMNGDDYEALKCSIKAVGLLEPITLLDGLVLDGNNRQRACHEVGIRPTFTDFVGPGTPLEFVVAKNAHRRHLTQSQRALIAARLATRERGRPRNNARKRAFSQSEAASRFGVSRTLVQDAGRILARGVDEVIRAVEEAKITVGQAATIVRRPREDQPERLRETLADRVDGKGDGKKTSGQGPKKPVPSSSEAAEADSTQPSSTAPNRCEGQGKRVEDDSQGSDNAGNPAAAAEEGCNGFPESDVTSQFMLNEILDVCKVICEIVPKLGRKRGDQLAQTLEPKSLGIVRQAAQCLTRLVDLVAPCDPDGPDDLELSTEVGPQLSAEDANGI